MNNVLVGRGWSFPLTINSQGGIALAGDRDELDQAILIILSTAPGQRVMRPTFGCRLSELVFAPLNAQTIARAQRYVEEAIGMWEPRIFVVDIAVTRDADAESTLLISIEYEIKATRDRRTLVHPFYLIPGE